MVDLKEVKRGDKVKFQTLTKEGLQTAVRPVTWVGYGMVTVSKFDGIRQFAVLAHEIQGIEKVKPC